MTFGGLVASASVFPTTEKAGTVVRLTAAVGALGVSRVLVSTDTFGACAVVLRESRHRAEAGDPRSKLRTSRHARATSSAVATAWWENWAIKEAEARARGVEQHGEPTRRAGASAASHQREQRHDQHRSRQQNHQDLRADQRHPGQPVHACGGQLEAGIERRHRQQVVADDAPVPPDEVEQQPGAGRTNSGADAC
ncbi:hypothetical protein ACFY1B_46165 [Streptomyces mirabilis]|uniref:hypothetical protein n=1 Tax=Streptomyces mirabilis TaxID=68239 RepID=UPI00369B59F9